MGDLHIGSSSTDEQQLREDLTECLELDARIILNGDIYDAILAKDHRRFMLSCLKKNLSSRDDLLNALIQYGVKFLEPYAEQIDVIGMGNHEYAVLKYHSVDLIRMTIDGLNESLRVSGSKHRIKHGGYCGFVQYVCTIKKCHEKSSGGTRNYTVLYHHGGGSESPVTKGMIDISRKRVNWVYDLFVFGHKHNLFGVKDVTMSLNSNGNLVCVDNLSVQTGSYLKNYHQQTQEDAHVMGYSEVFQMAPKPMGTPLVKWRFRGEDGKRLEQRALI